VVKNILPPLPVKKGVSPNSLWLPDGSWRSMIEFFHDRFPHLSLKNCIDRFNNKEIVTSDGTVLNADSQYIPGRHIFFYRELESELCIPFEEEIIYQDDNIVVADKPHFLPVYPSGNYLHETLLIRLRKKLNIDSLELCHRIDRETAGIVLLTKKVSCRAAYHALFADRKITKVYHALAAKTDIQLPLVHKSRLVKGKPYFKMKEEFGESNSETKIGLIEERLEHNLYELSPVTGKKHQLRVHLASLGIPILNDPLYPEITKKAADDFSKPLQLLAKSIQFKDPFSGKNRSFESSQNL